MEFQQITPTLFSEDVDKQNNNSNSNITHSVEPSPRFGDENETRNIIEGLKQQIQNNNIKYSSNLNHNYMKHIDLINQNQFQEFVKNSIFNENEQNNTVNSSNLKNSIQIETVQGNMGNQFQIQQINSNHQHQCSVQDDLHDFSFSQQLDNSNSCIIMDDQLSLNQNIITNNNNNLIDSIQRHNKRQKNSCIYQDDYIIDSDMESILMQSPPSNNQDILKKFCHSMDKNNSNLHVFRQSSQSIQSMKSNSKQNTHLKSVSLTQNKQSHQSQNVKNIRDTSSNNLKINKNANLPLQQSTNKYQQPILYQQQQQQQQLQQQKLNQNNSNTSNTQLLFSQSLSYIEQKWSDFQKWPESSPLRIELFALEMQSVYGSYYRNKVKVDELINNLVKEQSNRLAYIEAWKHKFRKTQKETMQAYVQLVEKNKEFLDNLFTNNSNNQNNNKHQQSIEEISPRIPPVMTQNSTQHNYTPINNNINNFSSSKNNMQRRKRQDRCRSKTPPGALQDQQSQKQNQQIPKLDISRTSNNDNSIIGTIESCRDELHTTNNKEYLLYGKTNNNLNKQKDSNNSVNNIVSNSTQLSPNRMSLGYKNPFKKLIQQKQKIRALQSPQLNNNSPRHNFAGSHYMTVDISNILEPSQNLIKNKTFNNPIQPYSPKSSQQQNTVLNNNSNESSPDMPSQLNTDKLSVYSQNHLIQNNTNQQSLQYQNNNTKNCKPVINMSIDLKNIGKNKENKVEQINTDIITGNLVINNQQENDDNQDKQVSQIYEEVQIDVRDTEEIFQSARNQQELQNEVQQIYQELLDIQDEESLIKQNVDNSNVKFSDTLFDNALAIEQQLQVNSSKQLSPDDKNSSIIDQTIQNIQISKNIQSQQQSPNQLEISQPNQVDLDSFIQSQILYSDRSVKKSVKSVRFSDENFEIKYEQSNGNKKQDKILYSSTQNTLTLESSNNQVENIQQQQEPLRIIVKKQNKQQHVVSSAVYLYNDNNKQKLESNQRNQLESILHTDDNNTNSAKHTMDEDNLNGFQTMDISQNNDQQVSQQQFHYNTQETEIYHNQLQDQNFNDQQQQWSHFKTKNNNDHLSLTPQNKTNRTQFSFIKQSKRNIDYNENQYLEQNRDDLIQDFEVFSQQEIIQPSSSFSPCYSRVSRLKQRRNYCFKNYVTIDSRFDKPIPQLDRLGREIKVNNIRKNKELEEHFEQIEISDSLPQQLVNVINSYNQQDSLFNTCLLTKQTVNDIIKFQDESNPQTLYTISELRLDSQQQQYFKEIFTYIGGGMDKDYKRYSLIKAHAQFYIPQANRLYQDLQIPQNRIYNSTGQVTFQNQNSDNNLYQINKILNKYDGLMRSRQSNMNYYSYQLKEEDGLIIIIQTNNQSVSLLKKLSMFTTKDYDNFLQIIKLRTIEQGNRAGEKDLVDIKLFYCVDYKLLIDDELKQNNLNIGLQEVRGLIDAIKVYDREL